MSDESGAAASARYEAAFDTLGLGPSSTPRDVKRAYRRAVAAYPPDRDPEAFRRVREAYELLSRPEYALDHLSVLETCVPIPNLRAPPPVELDHALPLATMRAVVAAIDAGRLLGERDGD